MNVKKAFLAACAAALPLSPNATARPSGPVDSPILQPASAGPRATELRLANWNVENLFDAVANQPPAEPDDVPPDAEFTPQSWRHWTVSRYQTKLDRLAEIVAAMKPDVLAMEEVENRGVIDDLAKKLAEAAIWPMPHVAHAESGDKRGIDVAIMSRFPIKKSEFLPNTGPRGILYAEIDADGAPLHAFALHWKSQLGNKSVNVAIRHREAEALRNEMRKRLADDPNAAVVALGDFNENLFGMAQLEGLKAATNRADALASISGDPDSFRPYNLVADIPEERRGTFYWNQSHAWNTLDGIFAVPGMLLPADRPGPVWRVAGPDATTGFAMPPMRWNDGRPNAYRRSRRYAQGSGGDKVEGETSYTGYSDHFPLLTLLVRVDPAGSETAPSASEPETGAASPQ